MEKSHGLVLKLHGELPKGVRIEQIKVARVDGTFELRGPGDPGDLVAHGQFLAGGDKNKEK